MQSQRGPDSRFQPGAAQDGHRTMRDFKGMKRQRGRNRGGGGGKPQQNANRAFESNGPEGVKVRGNAQHVFEKYQQLARDAASAGDRVLAENHLQHAEHYFRLLRALQPQRPAADIIGRDQLSSGFDIDFEEEPSGGDAETAEAEGAEAEENRERSEPRARDRDRDRDERQARDREERNGRDRDRGERDNRDRDNRDRDNRDRDDRTDRNEGRSRRDRWRDRDERRDRGDRSERGAERAERTDAREAAEPAAEPAERAGVLRDAEGGESLAPAFLQAPRTTPAPADPASSSDEKPARKPRRRAPRSFEGAAPAPSEGEPGED